MKTDTVLVTGGTGKIGVSIVKGLIQEGYKVICCTRNKDEALLRFEKTYSSLFFLEVDFFGNQYLEKIQLFLKENNLKINHFIHAARSLSSLQVEASGFTNEENLRKEFELQVVVPYSVISHLISSEAETIKSIINVGSIYGSATFHRSLYGSDLSRAPIQYSISKAALAHMTRELAARYPDIKVNQVSYGGIEGRVNEDFLIKYSSLCPMGRMVKENEVFGSIKFLMSDDSNYIQGQDLKVDGGWGLW